LLNHPSPSFKRRGVWRGVWRGVLGDAWRGVLGEFKWSLGIVEESLG